MRIATVPSGNKISYLFGPEGSGPLCAVDPGTELEALIAAARGRPIDTIILTSGFGSPDIVGQLRDRYDAVILAHRSLCVHLEEAGLKPLNPIAGGMRTEQEGLPYRFLATPGVDPFGLCVLAGEAYLFTGETLLVGGIGRLDGPGANERMLYVSLGMLAQLPPDLVVLAGRDLGHGTRSTLGRQLEVNPALTATSFEAFRSLR
ncbi:MAG: MBL fold metallo-hydrolase [Planctomycetota bacterium]|jgi:glyoxylase-like metal-dependent hydrolase (beta-lactamase superfamily II)